MTIERADLKVTFSGATAWTGHVCSPIPMLKSDPTLNAEGGTWEAISVGVWERCSPQCPSPYENKRKLTSLPTMWTHKKKVTRKGFLIRRPS